MEARTPVLKLAAFSSLHRVVRETPPDYRAELAALSGQPVRRLSRFAALGLSGALRCRKSADAMRADTALYFCSEQANIGDMSRVVHGITIERRPPTPLEFLAVSSNVTGFHVASQLGLEGPNLTLCRSDASFEAGLELAMLTRSRAGGALVAYVEDSAWPLEQHRTRVGWPVEHDVAECSHWLYFDRDCAAPLAVIESCTRHASIDLALESLQGSLDPAHVSLSTGLRVHEADAMRWQQILRLSRRFLYAPEPVFSKGLTAHALCRFVEAGETRRLLNLNRTASGEVYATVLRREGSEALAV